MPQTVGSSVQRAMEWLLYVAVVAYFVGLFAWNPDSKVALQYWFGTRPQVHDSFIVVAVAFLTGFCAAIAFSAVGAVRRLAAIRRYRQRVAALEAEIVKIRDVHAAARPRPVAAVSVAREE